MGERRNVPDRVIDSWIYKVKDVTIDRLDWQDDHEPGPDHRPFDEKYKARQERITNKIVKVQVKLCKTTKESEEAPHPLDTVMFEVRCDELKIKLEGTDIELLRAAMWAQLDKHFAIKWDRYYLVEVNEDRPWRGDGTGLEIVYRDVYKGTTWDDKNLMKIWRGHEQVIEAWPGAFKDKGGKILASIEATDENLAALKEFCERVKTLRGLLADFLRPEVIQQNLARLASCNLLPAPDPKLLAAR